MPYKTEHRRKFDDLLYYLQENNRSEITRKANGGQSLLFTYLPSDEQQYFDKAKEVLKARATFIDLNEIFVAFVEAYGEKDLKDMHKEYGNAVFKPEEDSSDPSYYQMILDKIVEVDSAGSIPVLINAGALYGTGITCHTITDSDTVKNRLKGSLVIFYPSIKEGDRLMYLGIQAASKYRSHIID